MGSRGIGSRELRHRCASRLPFPLPARRQGRAAAVPGMQWDNMGKHGRQRDCPVFFVSDRDFLRRLNGLAADGANRRRRCCIQQVFTVCSVPAHEMARAVIGGKDCQTACKPGSVPRSLRSAWTAIPLGRALPHASRDQPGLRDGNVPASALRRRRPPLFGLAPGGVYPAAPVARGAVRSCRTVSPLPARGRSCVRGGLFSVALSLGSPPPAVNRHRIPVEPGLSSSGQAPASGRPAVWPPWNARADRAGQAASAL